MPHDRMAAPDFQTTRLQGKRMEAALDVFREWGAFCIALLILAVTVIVHRVALRKFFVENQTTWQRLGVFSLALFALAVMCAIAYGIEVFFWRGSQESMWLIRLPWSIVGAATGVLISWYVFLWTFVSWRRDRADTHDPSLRPTPH